MTVNVLWEIKFVPVYAPLPLPCHVCEVWQHRWRIVTVLVVNSSAGSRPWDKGGFRSSRPLDERGGGLQKKFFWSFGSRVWSKNNGWPGPPGPLPWFRHWIKLRDWPRTLSAAELFIRSLDHLASLNKLGSSARRVRWDDEMRRRWENFLRSRPQHSVMTLLHIHVGLRATLKMFLAWRCIFAIYLTQIQHTFSNGRFKHIRIN